MFPTRVYRYYLVVVGKLAGALYRRTYIKRLDESMKYEF